MRQGQQNRRGRGRGNNNSGRKGQNPLTRNFESNGPDVKIKGTPAHVAEKYMSYARDALSNGDPVLAENFLQHAEHYNRIILTYREQQQAQSGADNSNGSPNQRQQRQPQQRNAPEAERESDGETSAEGANPALATDAPQPAMGGDNEGPRERQNRQGRNRQSRQRNGSEGRGRSSPANGTEKHGDSDVPADQRGSQRRQRDRFANEDDQPQFLRRSVRRAQSSGADAPAEDRATADDAQE